MNLLPILLVIDKKFSFQTFGKDHGQKIMKKEWDKNTYRIEKSDDKNKYPGKETYNHVQDARLLLFFDISPRFIGLIQRYLK